MFPGDALVSCIGGFRFVRVPVVFRIKRVVHARYRSVLVV